MIEPPARAPFQVLVLPFRLTEGQPQFAIFQRSDAGWWQAIAGGGEIGETPAQAARREVSEETGLSPESPLYALKSLCFVPCINFPAHRTWPDDTYVIPEYAFAVDVGAQEIAVSGEHQDLAWVESDIAHDRLKWDSNRTALWELAARIRDGRLAPVHVGRAEHGATSATYQST